VPILAGALALRVVFRQKVSRSIRVERPAPSAQTAVAA
jgi:hypothetical protein